MVERNPAGGTNSRTRGEEATPRKRVAITDGGRDTCSVCGDFLPEDQLERCGDCNPSETVTVFRAECPSEDCATGNGILREAEGFARMDVQKHNRDEHDVEVVAYEAAEKRGTRRYDLLREVEA